MGKTVFVEEGTVQGYCFLCWQWLWIDPQQPCASTGELKWSSMCWQTCDGVGHVLLHWWTRESTLIFVSIPKGYLLCVVWRDVSVVRVGTTAPDALCSLGTFSSAGRGKWIVPCTDVDGRQQHSFHGSQVLAATCIAGTCWHWTISGSRKSLLHWLTTS